MATIKPSEWARANKNRFAEEFLKDVSTKEEKPVAIFMAGLPGAGKTEFTKNLLRNARINVARLDMDEIATKIEGYKPEDADKYREGATILLERTMDRILKEQGSFIMDGTLGGSKAVANIERAIDHNYTVGVIWIIQKPELSWQCTKEREKVEHRAIDKNGFKEAYGKINDNIKRIREKFDNQVTIDIVKKDLSKIISIKIDATKEDVYKEVDNIHNKTEIENL